MRQRQSEILTLAGEMIQTKGYDSFSYNDLSLRLGIRKASIHHHFPKKQELGLAYLKYRFEAIKDIENQLRQSRMNPVQKLQAYFDLGVKSIEEHKICPISSFQADRWNINEEMNSVLTKIEDIELSMLSSILEDGRSSEELFFVGEAKDQANMILSSMKGAILYAQGQGLDFYKRTMNQVVANLQGSPSAWNFQKHKLFYSPIGWANWATSPLVKPFLIHKKIFELVLLRKIQLFDWLSISQSVQKPDKKRIVILTAEKI